MAAAVGREKRGNRQEQKGKPGMEFRKTPPKFCILKFFPDERRKSPCRKIAAPKPAAAAFGGRYGGGIIIAPEYKEKERACRSRGAPGAREEQSAVSGQRSARSQPSRRQGRQGGLRASGIGSWKLENIVNAIRAALRMMLVIAIIFIFDVN